MSSCTGDAYLGDVTREYSPELTVQHKGFVDGTAALDDLAEHDPDATQVVVVGKAGGSVAAPLYGGLVADLLSDAQITVFGAQSGAFPDNPDFNAAVIVTAGSIGAHRTLAGSPMLVTVGAGPSGNNRLVGASLVATQASVTAERGR